MKDKSVKSTKKKLTEKLDNKSKHYVLDTNVLLHDSLSIFAFKSSVVIIPFAVLEELDRFKSERGELGRNAREAIRSIDELRERGKLSEGVPLNRTTEGSILKVMPYAPGEKMAPLCADTTDNTIIQIVHSLEIKGYDVTFVSKDINARVKADAMGLNVEDYTKGAVEEDTIYRGWSRVALSAGDLRKVGPSRLSDLVKVNELITNQFIILESENNPENNRLFRFLGGTEFKEVFVPHVGWDFYPKNLEQLMALDLLMDDSVKLVSLLGPAGTGKTFLTLLAGLEKVATEKIYKKFLVTRPIVALGADIGYLPGDVEEKLHNWMMPIRDNIEFIFSKKMQNSQSDFHRDKRRRHHKGPRKRFEEHPEMPISDVDMLVHRGILSMEAITYMRGRSIPYQFIFIDEVQNLTPHEIKTVITRAGEGSKVILAGDPNQIDSPYLDFTTNGLTVSSEKFKGQRIFGSVFLEKSERSELAELAAHLL